ncbi:transposase family protein [Aneurinibacillus migulanus]|uniref:integrase catalytic domain-containing protein n=1 Tax=Aneurinibacillus migulanus TaxID=47500 RepID=UPI002E1D4D79|nr:transposase family protein [Aneurinibacillus migulanus]
MERVSLTPGIKFRLNDQEYMVRKYIGDDIEITNLSYDNQIEIHSENELLTAWYENRLTIKKEIGKKEEEIIVYDIGVLTDEERDLMEKRYQILKPIITGEVKSAKYKDYLSALPQELKNIIGSPASLYRWKKRWEATEDKRSLIPNDRFKKRDYNTDPIVVSIIEGILRKEERTGLQSTIRDKWIEMKERVKEYNETRDDDQKIKPCSLTTVFRIVQDKTDSYAKDKARHGVVQADLNKNGSTAEVEVERPLQRVEIDWTPIDLLIVDTQTSKRKRYYLVLAVDKYSHYPLGFYISPQEPDTRAIKQCLLHAMLPKVHLRTLYPRLQHDWLAYGVPETVVLDNAKVNESQDLEEVCSLLGIEMQYCPVKAGHHKGTIERTFKTLNSKVFHKIPGTTFSNPQEKSQYNSDKEACVTLRALYEIIHIALIDLIANDISPELGMKPEVMWKEGLKETRVQRTLPYKKEHLKLLLATGVDMRTITNKGIEIQSQFFQSPELMRLFDEKKRKKDDRKVRVRYDMADMRVIHIWDEQNLQYIEAAPTRNSLRRKRIDPNHPVHYEQLHAYSYNNEQAYRNFDTSVLAEAQNRIDEIVQHSRKTLRQIEMLPDDVRAKQFAEDLGAIQAIYDVQLAPSDIESLQLVEEITEKSKKTSKSTSSRKEKKGRNKEKREGGSDSQNVSPVINEYNYGEGDNEDLQGFETTIRRRV